MIPVSVIVPAFNAEETLGLCLKSLQDQTAARQGYEIIVVDDGSTDRTAEIAWQHPVRMVQQANAGPGAARNTGARIARGGLLLFTDADCAPTPEWVERLSEPFADGDVAGAKGTYATRQRELVARFVQMEYEHRYARMARQDRIDFIDTYSAAYRRDVFLTNDGFDTFYRKLQDQELSFRLSHKGYRLAFVAEAVVYHQHDRHVGEYWRRKLGIGYWKAALLREHPGRAVRDSHTPQVLKIQIGLLALLAPVCVLSAFWRPGLWGLAAVAAAFLVSALPLLIRIARRDPPVLLVAPWLIVIRGLALGTGLVQGFVRRSREGMPRKAALGGLERAIKRSADIVASVLGLVVTAPLLATAVVAVRAVSRGRILASEERIGQNGRSFGMLVLRTGSTAVDDNDAGSSDTVDSGRQQSEDVAGHRVTRLGTFLLRWRLDRLPQLWNVLCGHMSFVGPCPDSPQTVALYNDSQRERLAPKPGLTGPAQVCHHGDLTLDERIDLELEYIRHYSLAEDLRILMRTMGDLVRGRGSC